MKSILAIISAAGLLSGALTGATYAQQAATPLKIGLLGDFQSVYSDIGGAGNVEATKMAIEEFGGTMFGKPIELITADVQNKADIAASLARKWYENEAVDMIIDMPTSATALAGMEMSKQFQKIMIVTDAASSDITGKSCSPYTVHWTYDTYANAHTVGSAIVKTGGDTWFFITADYLFGHSIERDTGDVVRAAGGKVVGSAQAAAQQCGLLLVPAAGPGLQGQDHRPRQWRRRHHQHHQAGGRIRHRGRWAEPRRHRHVHLGHSQPGAETCAGPDRHRGLLLGPERQHPRLRQALLRPHEEDADDEPGGDLQRHAALPQRGQGRRHQGNQAVLEKMRATPVRDAFTDNGVLREDGRMVHSMFLLQVKKPEESKAPWDYYKVLAEVPGDEAFRPLKDGGCPLVK